MTSVHPAGWCDVCNADMSDDRNHYHCSKCQGRTSLFGHQDGCPVREPIRDTAKETMIDTRVQKVTTVVIKRRMKTPVNWNEVMKVTAVVTQEINSRKGLPLNATPSDDAMWFEPGQDDDEISLCYELTRTEDVRE